MDEIQLVEWASDRSFVICKADDIPDWATTHDRPPMEKKTETPAPAPTPEPQDIAKKIRKTHTGAGLTADDAPKAEAPIARTLGLIFAAVVLIAVIAGVGIGMATMDNKSDQSLQESMEKAKTKAEGPRIVDGIKTKRSLRHPDPKPRP